MISKNINLFIAILIFSPSYIIKAQTLKGRVINNEDNTPIPYATVYFTDLHTGVSCNENGIFEYHKQLPPSIKIKFSALGFQEKIILYHQKNITDSLIIHLNPSHIDLKELTISSTTGILQRYSITNIEIKSIKEIQINAPSNLGEAISNIPSVYQVSTGLGISKPVIRGLTGLRIVTLLNGLRIENQQWGGDHGMGITENGIGMVEVLKGPSSLLYGADALGGVLYFTDENYALNNEIEAKIESRFESFTKGTNNFITVKTNKNNWRFNIHGNYNNQADFAIPEGLFVKNSRFKEHNFKTSIGYNFKNWIINFRYNYLHNRIGIPGHTHDSIIKPELFKTTRQLRENTIPAQLITNHYAMLENKFYFNHANLSIIIGKTLNNLREYEEKVTIPGIDMLLDNNIYNARYTYSFTQKSQLIIGTQGMYQISSNSNNATEILLPNASMFDKGLYALWHIQTNTVEFQSGIRYDSRTISAPLILKDDGSNFSFLKNYSGFNYSLGINKKISHYLFRINASSGFRPPHLTELLSDGVHHGALRYEVGNKFLKNEFSQQLDIGLEFNNEHLSVLINPFYQYLQNFIYIAPNGSIKNGVPQFVYKQSKYATLSGGDFSVHYHPHFYHPLHVEHNISYIYAADEQNNPLPLIPQTRFNSTLRLEFSQSSKIQLEYISLQHLYFLPQNRVVQYETQSKSYQLFHLIGSFKLNFSNPIILRIGIKNLFNEKYIDHLSRLKNIGIENPGRNIFISIKYLFNYKSS